MSSVFSLPYLGSIGFYAVYIKAENPVFDLHEHFIKQTHRNRCYIESTEGFTKLTVPIEKTANKVAIKELVISYREDWQKDHWRSICSTYNSSAFFQYYDYLFQPFYEQEFKFLSDYNLKLHELILSCLKVKPDYALSENYIDQPQQDYRQAFNHKDPSQWTGKIPHYHQVFHAEKNLFLPNLSIIDLLFNEGPKALHILEQVSFSPGR